MKQNFKEFENGSAVVIVIAITLVFMSSSLYFISTAKQMVKTSEQLIDKLNVSLDAESAVEIIKYYGSTGVFSPTKLTNPGLLKIDYPFNIPLDGSNIVINESLSFNLKDSGALFDVYWALDPIKCSRFLEQYGVKSDILSVIKDSVADWFDKGDFHKLNGAEKAYYQMKDDLFEPRNFNAPQDICEMSLIKGLDNPEIFNLAKDYFVFAGGGWFNINTMDKKLLEAVLDINHHVAEELVMIRDVTGPLDITEVSQATNIDYDTLSDIVRFIPTRKVVVSVNSQTHGVVKQIKTIIDFKSKENKPYTVQEYIN